MKIQGTIYKRMYFFMSAIFRALTCLGSFIAYIVVKITIKPQIEWLNLLLIFLALGTLLSGLFNLCLAGLTATSYSENKSIQICGMIFTILTGGFFSTVFTCIAVGVKPTPEEIEAEGIIKIGKKKRKQKNEIKK